MKKEILYIALTLLLCAVLAYRETKYENAYGEGYDAGRQAQVEDNIKHGVMDSQGQWLPGFKLAK